MKQRCIVCVIYEHAFMLRGLRFIKAPLLKCDVLLNTEL